MGKSYGEGCLRGAAMKRGVAEEDANAFMALGGARGGYEGVRRGGRAGGGGYIGMARGGRLSQVWALGQRRCSFADRPNRLGKSGYASQSGSALGVTRQRAPPCCGTATGAQRDGRGTHSDVNMTASNGELSRRGP